jgi:hypothetical protein
LIEGIDFTIVGSSVERGIRILRYYRQIGSAAERIRWLWFQSALRDDSRVPAE